MSRAWSWMLPALMLAVLVLSPAAVAAPPPNDTPSGAELIPAAGPFDYLTSTVAIDEATDSQPPTPSCNNFVSQDVWYTFTPAAAGQYTFTVQKTETATTLSNMIMAVYTSTGGAAGPFTQVGCTNLFSKITLDLAPGTQYWIVVYRNGTGTPQTGNVQMKVKKTPPPPNDAASGAIDLPVETALQGTTVAGTDDYRLSGSACFTGIGQTSTTAPGRDVVYRFTPLQDGFYSFRVRDSTEDAALYVASALPAGPAPATVTGCLGAANRAA